MILKRLQSIKASFQNRRLQIATQALSLLAILIFALAAAEALRHYGKTFPSFFSIPNREVGAFHLPAWKESASLRYHDRIVSLKVQPESAQGLFARNGEHFALVLPLRPLEGRHFLIAAALPLLSSLLYLFAGFVLYRYHRGIPHRELLFCFHLFLSIYLATLFDFHSSHRLSSVYLLSFIGIGILLCQLAFLFPPPLGHKHERWRTACIVAGLLLVLPYFIEFSRGQARWKTWEMLFIAYTAAGYLLWLVRLQRLSRQPASPFIRRFSRYVFWGNLSAFLMPFLAGFALFLSQQSMPFSYIVPFTLLFPLCMVFATLIALLDDSRNRLVHAEKMAVIGSLLGGIAHEINNPLNLISANIDVLKDYLAFLKNTLSPSESRYRGELNNLAVTEEAEKIASEMDLGIRRAQEMMDLLKKMARAEEIPAETFQIKPAIEEALRFLKPRYPRLTERAKLHIQPESRLTLPRTLFLEVVLNLLSNACAALPAEAATGAIEIHFREENKWGCLGILDRGHGIAAQNLARIRDPFFTTRAPGEGSGLGLSLVERWVQGWGGNLEIASKNGQGTEVWVKIPL